MYTIVDNTEDEEEVYEGEYHSEYQSPNIFHDEIPVEEVHLRPRIIFNPAQIPLIFSESAQISAPTTKNGNFTYTVDDQLVSIYKGMLRNPPNPHKLDLKSKDIAFNNLLSHTNSKANAQDVPENCSKIASSSKPALNAAYRFLSRQQRILKNLIVHAQRNMGIFETEDMEKAEEAIKVYIQPIEDQFENINDAIQRIRALAIPKFIPTHIKRMLITAPILPGKIWNISSSLQNQIQTARTEYSKKFHFKTHPYRESRPFPSRGRFQYRRARPQRRGGFQRRRGDYKSETRNEKTEERS